MQDDQRVEHFVFGGQERCGFRGIHEHPLVRLQDLAGARRRLAGERLTQCLFTVPSKVGDAIGRRGPAPGARKLRDLGRGERVALHTAGETHRILVMRHQPRMLVAPPRGEFFQAHARFPPGRGNHLQSHCLCRLSCQITLDGSLNGLAITSPGRKLIRADFAGRAKSHAVQFSVGVEFDRSGIFNALNCTCCDRIARHDLWGQKREAKIRRTP